MKVLLLNGSPHESGTTFTALSEVAKSLNANGVETEIVCVGNRDTAACTVCCACTKTHKCVRDEFVNEIIEKIEQADGLIVGSPVYYAGLNGTLKSFLDKVFFAKKSFAYKPAAAVAVARRAGTTATLDIINKYFMISNMPVITSQYWNMVFGSNGEQAECDIEGMQTMRILGENMAYMLKCIKAGKELGVKQPEEKAHIKTNFYK